MSIPDIVSTNRHTALVLTWTRRISGVIVDLTNATITARMTRTDVIPNTTTAVTGTFTVTFPLSGIFTWAFSVGDVAQPGTYLVQFTATFPDTSKEISYSETMIILSAI